MLEAQAISLEPDNVQYRLDAAAGLANHKDFDNALRVLEAARHVARNHTAMAMIEAQTMRIRSMQEMMARAQSEEAGVSAEGSAAAPRATYAGGWQRVPSRAVVTTKQGSGQTLNLVHKAPDYPDGPPTGARHTVTGVVTEASCYYPSMLVLTLDANGKTLVVYRHNYFEVKYSAVGAKIHGDLHPCRDLVGKHARITYAAVEKTGVAGQMLTVMLVR